MLDCWQDLVEYIQTDIESSRQTTGNGRCNGNGNGSGNGSGSGSICGVSIALRRHFAISLFNHYLSPTAPQPVQLSPRVRDALMKELKMSAGTGSGLGGGGGGGSGLGVGGLGVDQSEPDVDVHEGPHSSPNAFLPVFEHCLKYLMKPWLEYLKTDIASFLE